MKLEEEDWVITALDIANMLHPLNGSANILVLEHIK
jgi:hypothetical protein